MFSFLHEICGFARYAAAVCFRKDGVPIGYVHIGADDSHDLGYALRSEFWRRGIASEACAAAIAQARAAGIPYLTATYDIDNPRSGAEGLTLSELQADLRARGVPKYLWPERIELREKIPRTPTGKVQRYLLR